jgi:hypothetical protein
MLISICLASDLEVVAFADPGALRSDVLYLNCSERRAPALLCSKRLDKYHTNMASQSPRLHLELEGQGQVQACTEQEIELSTRMTCLALSQKCSAPQHPLLCSCAQ